MIKKIKREIKIAGENLQARRIALNLSIYRIVKDYPEMHKGTIKNIEDGKNPTVFNYLMYLHIIEKYEWEGKNDTK